MFNRIDPRARLLVAFLFSIINILSQTIFSQLLFLASALLICHLAKVSWRRVARQVVPINFFLLFVWLALPWRFIPEGPQWLAFNSQGIWLALAITLKSNSIFLAWCGLLQHVCLHNILHALASWRVSPKLLALLFFIYRYGLLIKQEYYKMHCAMLTRGFKAKFNWHSLRSISQLVGNILVRAFDRAERVYQAMLCRGFNGRFYFDSHLRWHNIDSLALVVSIGWLALLKISDFVY